MTSKKLKVHAALSGLLFWFSVLWWIVEYNSEPMALVWPTMAGLVGLGWFMVTRLRTWWHHK